VLEAPVQAALEGQGRVRVLEVPVLEGQAVGQSERMLRSGLQSSWEQLEARYC
jgi:hypothetical protein